MVPLTLSPERLVDGETELRHSVLSSSSSFLLSIQNHKERGSDKVSYGLAAVQVEVNYVLCSYNRQV